MFPRRSGAAIGVVSFTYSEMYLLDKFVDNFNLFINSFNPYPANVENKVSF